eukprot:NODE_5570_length_571_cov_275.005814.p1 GENE.NODE_5570_length_571_cov_275.005814~~NODE_5570_length_571_cov_275.005814.p1  ORF type:complete len:167 (+),score=14.96 NODE_5570_length_571_cov_275.005814:35-535(+)
MCIRDRYRPGAGAYKRPCHCTAFGASDCKPPLEASAAVGMRPLHNSTRGVHQLKSRMHHEKQSHLSRPINEATSAIGSKYGVKDDVCSPPRPRKGRREHRSGLGADPRRHLSAVRHPRLGAASEEARKTMAATTQGNNDQSPTPVSKRTARRLHVEWRHRCRQKYT